MNWIKVAAFLAHVLVVCHCTPLPPQGSPMSINPFIYHWEPAKFDRSILDVAHERHALHRRRKRSINYNHHSADYGPTNEIRFNFFAHDREFRLILKEDPSSVFASDIQMENTEGPLDFDVSRVYTGKLEDDENSYVHGILTSDNLFDGTISTHADHYYIEPSSKYSNKLDSTGVHTIVYRLSDVKMQQLDNNSDDDDDVADEKQQMLTSHHCASERLHAKLKHEMELESKNEAPSASSNSDSNVVISNKKYKDKSDIYNYYKVLLGDNRHKLNRKRKKRWLNDELLETRNPSPPLDLEIPFNDDLSAILTRSRDESSSVNQNINNSNNNDATRTNRNNSRKNILINTYNPISDSNLRNSILLKNNQNILVNTYEPSNNNNNNNNNNNHNDSINNSTSRPSHKTHVEIITKNGATKKPNIIVNSYDPDVIITGNINNGDNNNNNFNLNVRNDLHELVNVAPADRKSTCMLYLQADHTFLEKMGSDEASIEAITRHVQRANVIYKNTDFNGDGKPDNITFMIKRIKVHNKNALKDPTYRFSGNYGVEKFLELFSEEDYDAFCLAYMFTYRDFEMGTLGLAWTGDLKNAGGVCEKNGHYRGSLKSLNTGIVTLLNYGKHVPPAVSHVTLAHEIGHNFGSPHDPEKCTPGGEDGNYIMFARATSGDKRNNNKFSSCSLKAIEPVLNAKARSAKGCFTEPQQSICGNGVVEPGEECDCGWEEDCKDTCCYPMSRHPRKGEKPCTLTPRAKCSPSQGPCCTTECTLKLGDKCRDDNGCRDPSYCDGNMPQCPPSVNKPNKTICNNEFVCFMGECTGSICLAYGLESCQCHAGPQDNKTKACDLCCKEPGEGKLCKSSRDWNDPPYDVPDMFAKAGTPCNDYNGYCDVFHICREVDPSGPLATLRKLLLSEESIASFRKILYHYWYLAILIILSILVASVLAMKYFGKRTNLKLKNVTIIHSTTAEAIRLFEENNGMIVHTAVRKKVPLKKKVRSKQSSKSHSTQKTPFASQLKDPAATKPIQTMVTASGNVTTTAAVPAKRPQKEKKLTKKKQSQRQSVPDEKSPLSETAPVKPSKKKQKTKAHKQEIIDYSSRSELHSNTFGKVQKWLMDNPLVTTAPTPTPAAQINHTAHVTKISKSASTPDKLTLRSSPKKTTKVKTKSVGNLNEKVKLQVVYKPPFKFSLKLSKNDNVKTQVVGRSKRKPRIDKKRVGAEPPRRRSAILVRPGDDTEKRNSLKLEPTYETLTPKKELPSYENLMASSTPINTATFRISKSASGTQIPQNSSVKPSSISKKPSVNNLTQLPSVQSNPNGRRSSLTPATGNLNLYGGSSQNLMRSSTTNLTKVNRNSFHTPRPHYELSRSSTTNLTKDYHRHGSHVNLIRGSTDDIRMRKNSVSSGTRQQMSRTPSTSNLTKKHSSSGNIYKKPMERQVSMPTGHQKYPSQRPHTSGCEDKHFVWPMERKLNELLPSDMEVMVSDVENILQDR